MASLHCRARLPTGNPKVLHLPHRARISVRRHVAEAIPASNGAAPIFTPLPDFKVMCFSSKKYVLGFMEPRLKEVFPSYNFVEVSVF